MHSTSFPRITKTSRVPSFGRGPLRLKRSFLRETDGPGYGGVHPERRAERRSIERAHGAECVDAFVAFSLWPRSPRRSRTVRSVRVLVRDGFMGGQHEDGRVGEGGGARG